MKMLTFVITGLAAFMVVAGDVHGQTSEGDDVVQLSTSDIGPFRPASHPDLSKVEREILERTNEFRQLQDLPPLDQDDRLQATAQDFADYMDRTDRYGHSADGRQPSERARRHDYPYCLIAENIAYRFQTTGFETKELAKEAVHGWKTSPGHRENLLRPHATEVGVGVALSKSTGVYYLVQLFGRPRSATRQFELTNRSLETIQYSLGSRRYELPPKFTRMHETCVPAKLLIEGDDNSIATTPVSGQHLAVTQDGEEIALEERSDDTAT